MSRNQVNILEIVGVIGLIVYFGSKRDENSIREAPAKPSVNLTEPKHFAGYACTEDCSGHEAGYRWAEEHDITDEEDCDAAGEHSDSPSFAHKLEKAAQKPSIRADRKWMITKS